MTSPHLCIHDVHWLGLPQGESWDSERDDGHLWEDVLIAPTAIDVGKILNESIHTFKHSGFHTATSRKLKHKFASGLCETLTSYVRTPSTALYPRPRPDLLR